ncbi:ATP-binding cassette domain-containing protein [Pilimelia columellifera]|uniref:ABC transporter ATP-binding protein n=1 Tax=Pilimelia columellifera subsp. columellifera TaxID=706583 RepID=A0ABN3NQZ2_9ACTN
MTTLDAQALCQGYGRRRVVHEFSARLDRGVVGLLGPNGAGKTTLLETLALVRPPETGRLEIVGTEVRDLRTVRRARQRVGFQPQNFPYPGGLTVEEFLHYAAWLRELPKRRTGAAVAAAITQLELTEHTRSRLRTLSGGTLQRVGVAQALVHDPAVVILDEPTVGLDPAQRVKLRAVLRGLAASRLVIVSTHIVDDVVHTCDQVLVFLAGKVHFAGTPQDLNDIGLAAGGAPTDGHAMSAAEQGYLRLVEKTQGARA